jgi:integrase
MAVRKLFTDPYLKSLKPAPKGTRYMVWDKGPVGVDHLAVRVTEKRRVSFIVVKRPKGGAPIYETIGAYGGVTLASARARAREDLVLIADGKVPTEERRARDEAVAAAAAAEEAKKRAAEAGTFERVASLYKADIENPKRKKPIKPRSRDEIWRPFRKVFVPAWGVRPLAAITRRDIFGLLEREARRGKGVAANRAKTALSAFFTWAINAGHVETSPMVGMEDFVAEQDRDRVLADWELRIIWAAAGKMGAPYGSCLKLLALTGVRREEAARATRDELHDLDDAARAMWIIPAARTKAGREHRVPLSTAARNVIAAVTAPGQAKGNFLFSARNGERPVSGFNKAKRQLDDLVAEGLAELNSARAVDGLAPLKLGDFVDEQGRTRNRGERWVVHDLRRSMSTGMQVLKIPDEVRKAVLNHSRATDLGVTAVYSRHDYAQEKREALDRWATHLLGIVEPPARDNVVPLARPA